MDYLVAILLKYDDRIVDYYNEVFLQNIDVWGLITSYSPILEKYPKHAKLRQIFSHYLYNPEQATKVIDVDALVKDLKALEFNGFT